MGEEIAISLKSIPFVRALDVHRIASGKEECHLRLPVEPRFRQVSDAPGIAAGLIAGVLDQLGSATLTAFFGERHAKATLSMSIGFARNLEAGGHLDLIGRGQFYTGETGSVELNAKADDGRVLAHGLVEFMIGAYPGAAKGTGAIDHSRRDVRARFEPEEVEASSFDEWMGIRSGQEIGELDWATRLTGSTGPVVAFHGGIVAAAAISQAQSFAGQRGSYYLSHFTLEYLRAAKDQMLTLRPEVVRETRKTLVLRTEVFQEEGARHVATTTQRFVKVE